jgi:thiamine-phosphate pyrophosphorylase
MDDRLVAWGRAVKSRGRSAGLPPLWLFTDAIRLPDPCAAVARLPPGLCGVVFRHDGAPDRYRLGKRLARICRARHLLLAVAGDWRLAASLRAGMHLRGGWRPGGMPRWMKALTSSAHCRADLVRAARAGADLAFLSPAFATASHPGAAGLGAARWSLISAISAGITVGALGGIDGVSIRRLRCCRQAGAIGALA